MKTMRLLCLLLALFASTVSSQTINEWITLTPAATRIVQVNGSDYQYGNYDIGKRTIGGVVYIFRSYFDFNLGAIPDNATILQVEVVYQTSGSNYSFKLTKLTSASGTLQAIWTAIGNGSALHTGVTYGSGSFYSNSIKTEITSGLGSNQLLIGALSESETTDGSFSTLTLTLNVNYSYPAPPLHVTVRNDLYGGNGGNVGVAIHPSNPVSRSSPYSFLPNVTNRLKLAAYDNQNVNGKTWFFNDEEYPYQRSEWRKKIGQQSTNVSTLASCTTNPLTTGDEGAEFVAYLKTTSYTRSGNMSSNEIWFTPVTLQGNVNVLSGVTLTISAGAAVNMNGYTISNYGTISVTGGTLNGAILKTGSTINAIYPTIQAALNAAVSGQTVVLSSGTYSGDINMKPNVLLQGAGSNLTTINGKVNFDNDNYAGLKGVKVNKKISVLNSDHAYLNDVKAGSADCYIEIFSSALVNIDFLTSTVSSNQVIFAHDFSDMDVWNGDVRNKFGAINLSLSSPALIRGIYFCQNVYDISADPGCTADAWDCSFSSSEEGGSVQGEVYWTFWDWCGLQKAVAKNNDSVNSADPTPGEYREAMSIYNNIKSNLRQDRLTGDVIDPQKYAVEFATAIELFKQVVTNYSSSPYAISSLGRIAVAYRILDTFEPLAAYMKEIASDAKLNQLKPFAMSASIPFHIKKGDYLKAIDLFDQIIQEFPTDPMVCELTYGKGLIYKYFLYDPEKAKEMFNLVISNWPDHKAAQSAKDELEQPDLAKDSAAEQEPVGFSVQNYPNPFNPVTTIRYSLPVDAKVVIKVYDILGREVTVLVDEVKRAGSHSVSFDATNFASGVYFYSISAGDFHQTKKMLLVK